MAWDGLDYLVYLLAVIGAGVTLPFTLCNLVLFVLKCLEFLGLCDGPSPPDPEATRSTPNRGPDPDRLRLMVEEAVKKLPTRAPEPDWDRVRLMVKKEVKDEVMRALDRSIVGDTVVV